LFLVSFLAAFHGRGAGAASGPPAWCSDSLLRQSAGSKLPTRYQVRQSGRYCEGVVPRPSAGGLELVGYQRGVVSTDAASSIHVAVSSDVRKQVSATGPIRVLGVDWSGEFSYRFDGNLDDGDIDVDTRDVIAPLNIRRERLAFLASISTGLQNLYLPVAFVPASTDLNAYLVSPISYRRIRATVTEPGTMNAIQPDVVLNDVSERSLIAIRIQPAARISNAVLRITCWDNYRDTPADGLALNIVVPQRP